MKFKSRVELVEVVLAYLDQKRVFSVPMISDLLTFRISEYEMVQEWRKKIASMVFYVNRDIEEVCSSVYTGRELILPDQFPEKPNSPPALLKLWENGKISTETLFVLDKQFSLFKIWNSKIKPDIVWKLQSFYINKYCRFVNFADKDFSKGIDLFKRNKLNLQEATNINF
jgi:hypothetical protein